MTRVVDRPLSWLVVVVLADAARPMDAPDVLAAVHRWGFRPASGLETKAVSDVLRYLLRLGRVERLRHGVYVYVRGSVPRTTLWRWRQTFRQARRAAASVDPTDLPGDWWPTPLVPPGR